MSLFPTTPFFQLRWILAALIPLFATVRAAVSLPAFLGSGMVLQRDMPVRLRGWANPDEIITATQGEATATATASADRRWSLTLPALPAGPAPDIVIKGENTLLLDDLLAGDVWLCSGQSNMEFKLSRSAGGAEAVASADFPQIRLFTVGRQVAATPLESLSGAWQRCTPESAAGFSAVGFFFGRDLHKKLGVPIGLIHSSWGGTPAEAWVAPEITRNDPVYAPVYAEWDAYRADYPQIKARYDADMARWTRRSAEAAAAGTKPPARPLSKPHPDENHQYPGNLYNGMIHPLTGLPLKGVAWYHGTSNTKRAAQYHRLLTSLVTDWRARWGQGDLPFLIVSLANFHARETTPPEDSSWATLREAQARVAAEQPAAALAVTIDIGDPDDVHPLNKLDVGLRLSLAALRTAYGQKIVSSGPVFKSVNFEADAARIHFSTIGGGLVAGRTGGETTLTGFALVGLDRKWRWAAARIEDDTVLVSHPEISTPAYVRYGWADNPGCNLYNREGLPAVPFRSDLPFPTP